MNHYEVLIADGHYRSSEPLTYASEKTLSPQTVVTVSLRNRLVNALILRKVKRPAFEAKTIKSVFSNTPLPAHCTELARWMSTYYGVSLGECLRQFAPSKPGIRQSPTLSEESLTTGQQLRLDSPLTQSQKEALEKIKGLGSNTVLLHGETGSGKTRVYLEMARETLSKMRSVIILTPEIALTSQLAAAISENLQLQPIVLHSQLTTAQRKAAWRQIIESSSPLIVIGPRSALFSPLHDPGLIIVDEAHEPAYKQEQAPRYHALRAASQLGALTGARVVIGSATPSIVDYYLATERSAVVKMKQQALTGKPAEIFSEIVDIKDRRNFSSNPYLSDQLIASIKSTLSAKKQVLIYFNRRGTARLVMCSTCGWRLHCPNCDVPLTYHADSHSARCHICGHKESPPTACPQCGSPDVIYKSIGTKALIDMIGRLFPGYTVRRFDSDNTSGERINELYPQLLRGDVDIIIGTQLLAKGFDLPRLGLVGIVVAETSIALPDFTAEERTFQLLYQVIGRVGRGHGKGKVIIQSYDIENPILKAAVARDYDSFYKATLAERQRFKFPPYSFLAKLVCRRLTQKGAHDAAAKLKKYLTSLGLPVEIIGPAPSFYEKRGKYYNWQLVVKGKQRTHLQQLIQKVPAGWSIDLDPADLL